MSRDLHVHRLVVTADRVPEQHRNPTRRIAVHTRRDHVPLRRRLLPAACGSALLLTGCGSEDPTMRSLRSAHPSDDGTP